jgi:NhaA family Na+:H+ antiporter
MLPAIAALGGMAIPALIYAGFNGSDSMALRGWAIPTATDIAFVLGLIALLGARVPAALKVFVTAVAIFDDLGAIVVIAIFYTERLSLGMLVAAGIAFIALGALNRMRVSQIGPYVVIGIIAWVCVLKSGVHATLAGVMTALAIPMSDGRGGSPLRRAEHALEGWVAFLVLPMFGFVNAGVSLRDVSIETLGEPITLGIAMGLLVGKAAGVFIASRLAVMAGWAEPPAGATWRQFFGVCVLCGIGFTMSLFIGALAFQGLESSYETSVKLGVLLGSLFSAALGTLLLLEGPTPGERSGGRADVSA